MVADGKKWGVAPKVPQRRYRRKRGNRHPGAGGRRVQEGRAVAGKTPSRPGRGSGCRGLPVGKSAPGGGWGPYSLTVGSQQGHLRKQVSMSF